MHEFIAGEPDVPLRILSFLPLRSVLRLYSTCSLLQHFIAKHQRAIRNGLDVNFTLTLSAASVTFSLDIDDSTTKRFEVVKRRDASLGQNLIWQRNGRFVVLKSGNCWQISPAPTNTVEDLLIMLMTGVFQDFHLSAFDAYSGDLATTVNGRPLVSKQTTIDSTNLLLQFLIMDERKVAKLFIPTLHVDREKIGDIVKSLHVRHLEIKSPNDPYGYLRQREAQVREAAWDLTSEMFHENQQLRVFRATDMNCEVHDEDLQHFDTLDVEGGRLAVTVDGVYAWARQRLNGRQHGNSLRIVISDTDFLELMARLEAKFFKRKTMPYSNEEMFRGPTGTWMKAVRERNSWLAANALTHVHLTVTALMSHVPPKAFSRAENFPSPSSAVSQVTVHLKTKKTTAQVLLRATTRGSMSLVFHYVVEKPINGMLVGKWDDVALYNLDYEEYAIQVTGEEEDHLKREKALRLLGEELGRVKFASARCESGTANAALRLLELIQAGYQGQIDRLSVHGHEGPFEEILTRVIQSLQVNRFSFSIKNVLEIKKWKLSERFFADTPTLTALTIRPCLSSRGDLKHYLGVTDETLQRFNKFKAKHAQTPVTREGIQRWVAGKMGVKAPDFGEDETKLKFSHKSGKVHAVFESECLPERYIRKEGRRLLSISYLSRSRQGDGESSEWDSDEQMWAAYL